MRNSPVMKTRTFLSLIPILPLALVAADSTVPAKLPLWPGEPPSGTGTPVPGNPSLTVHHPEHPNGTAVVICPGGGYGGLVTGAEGHGIAKWLNQHGITGIVLEYRLPKGNSFVPLADAQRAIQTTRTHAANWKINPKQIGIIGFSAGGHLASTAATHYTADNPAATDPVQRVSSRPDFQILIYPVVTMGEGTHGGSKRNLLGESPTAAEIQRFSNETQVTKDTPPAYLAHARRQSRPPQTQHRLPPRHASRRSLLPPPRVTLRRTRPQRIQRPQLGRMADRRTRVAERTRLSPVSVWHPPAHHRFRDALFDEGIQE